VGRPEKVLDPRDPVQAFAQRLRDLRRESGGSTYAELAGRSHYSAATLSEAARGTALPTWAVTAGYVQACGGDPDQWRSAWEQARDAGADPETRNASRTDPRATGRRDEPPMRDGERPAPVGGAPGGSRAVWKRGSARLIAAGAVLVLFAVTGMALGRTANRDASANAGPAPAVPSAAILKPAHGQVVENATSIPVHGRSVGLPPSRNLWCFVANDEGRWYPHTVHVMGDLWECQVGIGPEVPKMTLVLTVHIVVTPPEATAEIQNALARSTPEWSGLDGLPAGAKSLASINIIRPR
jgi:transcriptional regulator with XRE-family HTH domain